MTTYADPDLVRQLQQEQSFYPLPDPDAAPHEFAVEVEIKTGNVLEAGAAAVAGRMVIFGKPGMHGWSISLPGRNFEFDNLETIGAKVPELWPGTRLFLIQGIREDANAGETVLKVIGGRA